MPLRWDPLLVRTLAAELHERLAGARLRALRLDGGTRDLVLLFREATLAWPLHPHRGDPLFLPAAEPAPHDLPLASRIRRVSAPADERILIFELLPVRSGPTRDLMVELLGNQWNAVVTEGPERRIRHVLVRRDGPRPLRVGDVYEPPPSAEREGSEAPIPLERWHALLESVPPPQRRRALVARIAWTSPINAGALLDALDDTHAGPTAALDAGYALWRDMAFGNRTAAPTLLTYRGDLQPYPWPLLGTVGEAVPSLLDAFRVREARSGPAGKPRADAVLPPALVIGLERDADRAVRKAARIEVELASLEDAPALRAHADLLLARFKDVPTGATSVELEGFSGERITVALDPALAVHENAAALYERGARVERARARLPVLLAKAQARADALQALVARTHEGEATAEELRAVLPEHREDSGVAPSDPTEILPYRRYRSSGGLEIRVGRGAKRNDELTFRHSAPGDVWMHARHTAGAHVVLRWKGPGNPPAQDLYEAGVLAALNSKARTSGSVPVDWTLRKYVRKPRGAAPGAVLPQRVKTIFVEPDASLAERLAEE